MEENTNKAIAVNSIILYIRLAITSILGIITTRYALKALGVDDFGLFSVLGSIIGMIDVINAIMVSATTRFMAVAIGKGDIQIINKQFNINKTLHIFAAIAVLLIGLPIGLWYISKHINYSGDIWNAIIVFCLSTVGSIISFLGIPYNGLLNSKENFIIPSIVQTASSVLKCAWAIVLCYFFEHKLLLYALMIAVLSAYPTIVYKNYCKKHFNDYVSYCFVKDFSEYRKILSFIGWSGYGTIACIAKSQGVALIINMFFTTTMNAALGVANTINSFIMSFAQNLSQPMLPQITKSFASKDIERCDTLLCMSTKFSFLLMLLVSSPFLIDCNIILEIWLNKVPEYSVSFVTLLIIDSLVNSFNSGITTYINATGKIALYQFTSNTIRILVLVFAYHLLKVGYRPEALFVAYIASSIIIIIANQLILNKELKYNTVTLIKKSYLPSIMVVLLFAPFILIKNHLNSALNIMLGCLYLILLILFIGLNSHERSYLLKLTKIH